MLENIPSQSTMIELLGQSYLWFGKSYVRPSMKNMIWKDCGIQVVKIGPMSTNIVKVEELFAAYTQKVTALVL